MSALGPSPRRGDGTVRDFALGRTVPRRKTAEFGQQDLLAVLLTLEDDRTAWVRAGLALQRVLLTATVQEVSSGLLTSRWRCRLCATSSSMPPSPAVAHKR